MSEPKALLNKLPHIRIAVLKPSSLRLYQFERRNKAPCLSVRTRVKRSLVTTHREERAFTNPQEETRQDSVDKVAGDSGQGRYETPKDRTSGEVYGGFPEMTEEHVPSKSRAESMKARCGSKRKAYEGTCMEMYPT